MYPKKPTGPIRPEDMERRAFQRGAAATFDAQAAAIGELRARLKAQGEFLADLSVRIDHIAANRDSTPLT